VSLAGTLPPRPSPRPPRPAATGRRRRAAARRRGGPAARRQPAVTEEAVENPYGLKALWGQGDFVAKGTLIILVIMSMGSWYVIFTKLFEQRSHAQERQASRPTPSGRPARSRPASARWKKAAPSATSPSRASRPASTTRARWSRPSTSTPGSACRSTAPSGSVKSRLQDGLAVLATVGSTAPFVGLFGTVWGIYNALVKIGISGQASIDKVAGPVGEALIMTAIGLAVAVPAVMGYNWLMRRNKAVMDQTRAFAATCTTCCWPASAEPAIPRRPRTEEGDHGVPWR
jgi:biopolymer transport protein ExbB